MADELSVLSSLPDRPLTEREAEHLGESGRIAPLSMLSDSEIEETCYTLMVRRGKSTTIIGYAEREGGWLKVETIRDRDYSQDRLDEVVGTFFDEHYEEHGRTIMDPETGEVREEKMAGQ